MSPSSRYAAFEVRTSCPHCGNPLILNGPLRAPECPACQKTADLKPGLWKSILEDIVDEYDGLAPKQGYTGTLMTGGFTLSRGYWRLAPRCQECKTAIPADEVETGEDRTLGCPRCQAAMVTYPAPDWLRAELPGLEQVFGGEREGGPSVVRSGEPGARPVVLACPRCGGALEITAASPRLAPCAGCQADVYLPDEVWHRFHPAATVQEWFVRLAAKQRAAAPAPEPEGDSAGRDARDGPAGSDPFDDADVTALFDDSEDTPVPEPAARRTDARWQHFEAAERAVEQQREVERAGDRAWLLTGVALLCWAVLDLFVVYDMTLDFPALPVLIPAAAVSSLLALYSGMKLIKLRTGTDWILIFFETGFYVPFCAFPGLGLLFALWVLFKMVRGRIGGATITSTSGSSQSSKTYDVMELKGAGLPAGLLILAYAASLQLVFARMMDVF